MLSSGAISSQKNESSSYREVDVNIFSVNISDRCKLKGIVYAVSIEPVQLQCDKVCHNINCQLCKVTNNATEAYILKRTQHMTAFIQSPREQIRYPQQHDNDGCTCVKRNKSNNIASPNSMGIYVHF
jgi:hypothetical protein